MNVRGGCYCGHVVSKCIEMCSAKQIKFNVRPCIGAFGSAARKSIYVICQNTTTTNYNRIAYANRFFLKCSETVQSFVSFLAHANGKQFFPRIFSSIEFRVDFISILHDIHNPFVELPLNSTPNNNLIVMHFFSLSLDRTIFSSLKSMLL